MVGSPFLCKVKCIGDEIRLKIRGDVFRQLKYVFDLGCQRVRMSPLFGTFSRTTGFFQDLNKGL